jgi:hypothetical protein
VQHSSHDGLILTSHHRLCNSAPSCLTTQCATKHAQHMYISAMYTCSTKYSSMITRRLVARVLFRFDKFSVIWMRPNSGNSMEQQPQQKHKKQTEYASILCAVMRMCLSMYCDEKKTADAELVSIDATLQLVSMSLQKEAHAKMCSVCLIMKVRVLCCTYVYTRVKCVCHYMFNAICHCLWCCYYCCYHQTNQTNLQ